MSGRARGFGSDNHAGALPEVLAALAAVNEGHAESYGHDRYSASVADALAARFDDEAQAFFVFNGTGANVVAMRAMCRPWEAVVCADTAHLNVDEGGAPERIGGLKLLTVPTPDGKLTPDLVAPRLVRFGDEHAVQPRVVSITQSTEMGTLYTPAEIAKLAEQAHAHGLLLHVDGSRLTNAAAALDISLAEAAGAADAISFGGTKAGLLFGEAVIVRHREHIAAIPYLRKQSMQLASKMRFVAAQFDALLQGERWRAAAGNANAMAARLAEAVGDAVTITQPVQANAVFAIVDPERAARLREDFFFYTWDEATGEVRWMCAWDTTEDDVDAFAAAIRG
jgi:threonine aldolase